MEDLKPCPFCGAPPMLHGRLGRFNVLHSCDAIKTNIGAGKKDYVIAKWNTRTDTDEVKHLKESIQVIGFMLAQEKAEVARLREALGGVKSLCVALFDGADRCSQAPYYIVQPFLGIVKDHAAIIEEHQLLNNKGPAE